MVKQGAKKTKTETKDQLKGSGKRNKQVPEDYIPRNANDVQNLLSRKLDTLRMLMHPHLLQSSGNSNTETAQGASSGGYNPHNAGGAFWAVHAPPPLTMAETPSTLANGASDGIIAHSPPLCLLPSSSASSNYSHADHIPVFSPPHVATTTATTSSNYSSAAHAYNPPTVLLGHQQGDVRLTECRSNFSAATPRGDRQRGVIRTNERGTPAQQHSNIQSFFEKCTAMETGNESINREFAQHMEHMRNFLQPHVAISMDATSSGSEFHNHNRHPPSQSSSAKQPVDTLFINSPPILSSSSSSHLSTSQRVGTSDHLVLRSNNNNNSNNNNRVHNFNRDPNQGSSSHGQHDLMVQSLATKKNSNTSSQNSGGYNNKRQNSHRMDSEAKFKMGNRSIQKSNHHDIDNAMQEESFSAIGSSTPPAEDNNYPNLVFDTSSFLQSDISVLELALEKKINVCIPYMTLHELDGLSKGHSVQREGRQVTTMSENVDLKHLAMQIRSWILQKQKQYGNSRVRLQKKMEFVKEYHCNCKSNDDYILGFAVYLQESRKGVVCFVSEDKVLCSKAIAELDNKRVMNYNKFKRMTFNTK